MAKMKCSECGYEINLIKEDGYVVENLPNCKECRNKYWKVSPGINKANLEGKDD